MRACHLDWQQKEERTSMHHLVMAPTLSPSLAGTGVSFLPIRQRGILNIHPCSSMHHLVMAPLFLCPSDFSCHCYISKSLP